MGVPQLQQPVTPIADSLPPAAARPSRDITRGNWALPCTPALYSKITTLPQQSETRDKNDFPIGVYPSSFTFPIAAFPRGAFLTSPPHPAPRLLIAYLLHSLFIPPSLFFLGGITFALSFHPSHTKVPPYFWRTAGWLFPSAPPLSSQADLHRVQARSSCASPNTSFAEAKKVHLCRRQAAGWWQPTRLELQDLFLPFAVSHSSLEAVPAWASAGRSEPSLPTQRGGQPRASSREVEQSFLRGSSCTAKTTACRSGFLILPTHRSKGLHPAGLPAELEVSCWIGHDPTWLRQARNKTENCPVSPRWWMFIINGKSRSNLVNLRTSAICSTKPWAV